MDKKTVRVLEHMIDDLQDILKKESRKRKSNDDDQNNFIFVRLSHEWHNDGRRVSLSRDYISTNLLSYAQEIPKINLDKSLFHAVVTVCCYECKEKCLKYHDDIEYDSGLVVAEYQPKQQHKKK